LRARAAAFFAAGAAAIVFLAALAVVLVAVLTLPCRPGRAFVVSSSISASAASALTALMPFRHDAWVV
jgi:hypothetical protein